ESPVRVDLERAASGGGVVDEHQGAERLVRSGRERDGCARVRNELDEVGREVAGQGTAGTVSLRHVIEALDRRDAEGRVGGEVARVAAAVYLGERQDVDDRRTGAGGEVLQPTGNEVAGGPRVRR